MMITSSTGNSFSCINQGTFYVKLTFDIVWALQNNSGPSRFFFINFELSRFLGRAKWYLQAADAKMVNFDRFHGKY